MNGVAGRPALLLLLRRAEVLEDLVVDGFDLTAGRKDRDQAGNAVHDQARIAFAYAQRFLGALPLFDVGVDSVPFDNIARFIARRIGAEQEPSVLSVASTQPRLGLSQLSGSQDGLPRGSKPVEVVGMDRGRPAPTLCLFGREAHVVEIMLVEEFGSAVRSSRPRQRVNGIDDEFEISLARRESLFGALFFVDVDVQSVPAHDASVRVAEWQPANLKPTILSVGAAKSLFGVVRLSCRGRMQGRVEDVL